MQKPEPPVIKPFVFVFSWRRFLVHSLILGVCTTLGVMTWYFSKPHSIRFYDNTLESPIAVTLTPGIDMALDKKSVIAVREGYPLKVELFGGNVYFDIENHDSNELELRVGKVIIKDTGTRFSVRMQKSGEHQIAVENGQVEVYLASGTFQVNMSEQVTFNEQQIIKRILVQENNVAPWRLIKQLN